MSAFKSGEVEQTLQKPDIHQQWESAYRTPANEKFAERQFDYVRQVLNPLPGATVLDAGCGIGANAVRLAKRGFKVVGVDVSATILQAAREHLAAAGLAGQVKLQPENILSLSFADETFDYVLCWGVLMHIPDIGKAVSELARVLKKGGLVVVSEVNLYSLQSLLLALCKRVSGRGKAPVTKTPAGLEYGISTPAGRLITRYTNMGWLKQTFKSNGCVQTKRAAGQFCDLYTRFSSPLLQKVIHRFNHLWFSCGKIPYLALGNILFLKKQGN